MSSGPRFRLLLAVGLLLACAFPTAAAESPAPTRLFVEGLNAYKEGDFNTAIDRFDTLVGEGRASGKLYYNLGNAYLKADRLGHAVWSYEKALRLIPGDPDLAFNLNHARSLIKDQPEAEGQALGRALAFWRYQLTTVQIQWLALGLNLVFWALLIIRRLMGRRPFRSWLLMAALPAALLAATAAYNQFEARFRQDAIVLPDQLAVRAGRTPGATELFRLHAGTRVRVQASRDDHLRIAFDRDKIGWVPADALGLI